MADDGIEVKADTARFGAMLAGVVSGLGDMQSPMDAMGAVFVPAARAAAPKRSGRTAAAHTGRYLGRNRWRLTVDTPYAAVIHWGYPAHGIRRQPWALATFLRNTAWMDRMEAAQQAAMDEEVAKA